MPGDDGPTPAELAHELGADLPTLMLRGPEALGGAHGFGESTIEILIPRSGHAAALRHLEAMSWCYRLGASGAWRLFPAANFWWPGPVNLFVYWGLPAHPFPARAMARLERALWAGARRHPAGYLEPDPAALLVYLAFQAARPGAHYHRDDVEHFAACRRHVEDWARVSRVAAQSGLTPAVRNALTAAEEGGARAGPSATFGGLAGVGWRLAMAIQRRARPQRLAALLAGTLDLGDAPVRCRLAGVELRMAPGVFVPTPDASLFVGLTLDRIGAEEHPIVIEVGTGCGAIALAVARAHPGAVVHAADTSRAAIRWARRNRRRLRLRRVSFHRGSLLQPFARAELTGRVSVILANLPFYPSAGFAPIGTVPRDTIEGHGEDGLGLLRDLARDARPLLAPRGALVLQMFDWQWERLGPELEALGLRPGAARTTGPFVIATAELV